ncbi:hypothetical protein [Nibribacter koreensis]
MRFFFLSSLVVLGLLNITMPVQVEIYASHCAQDKSLLQLQDFQVTGTDPEEVEDKEDSVTEAQKNFARKGLEAIANSWLEKLNLVK